MVLAARHLGNVPVHASSQRTLALVVAAEEHGRPVLVQHCGVVPAARHLDDSQFFNLGEDTLALVVAAEKYDRAIHKEDCGVPAAVRDLQHPSAPDGRMVQKIALDKPDPVLDIDHRETVAEIEISFIFRFEFTDWFPTLLVFLLIEN